MTSPKSDRIVGLLRLLPAPATVANVGSLFTCLMRNCKQSIGGNWRRACSLSARGRCTGSMLALSSASLLSSTVLHCPPLSSTVLHCPPLSSTVLHCPPLSSTVLRCPPLSSAVLRFGPSFNQLLTAIEVSRPTMLISVGDCDDRILIAPLCQFNNQRCQGLLSPLLVIAHSNESRAKPHLVKDNQRPCVYSVV